MSVYRIYPFIDFPVFGGNSLCSSKSRGYLSISGCDETLLHDQGRMYGFDQFSTEKCTRNLFGKLWKIRIELK